MPVPAIDPLAPAGHLLGRTRIITDIGSGKADPLRK
jgi:hypothetical protein